jgi:hypothetical protein
MLQLSRQSRRITAIIALVGMLFTQIAVASYVCSHAQSAPGAESTAPAAHVDMHRHFSGGEGEQADNAALCHAHCQPDSQSLDKPASPGISPFAAVALISTVSDAATVFSRKPVAVRVDQRFLVRVTAPPLSIRNCCFRI